jgi:hypothetical protein
MSSQIYCKCMGNVITKARIICIKKLTKYAHIQSVPELAPQRKQACADNKKDSKLTKINFLLAQITELQSF